MKSLAEKLANRCIHFTGLSGKKCKKGVAYDDVIVPGSRPFKFPCFKSGALSGGSCTECRFFTKEEAEKEAAKIEDHVSETMKVLIAVKEHIKLNKTSRGFIPHEGCGGDIEYQVAMNGHVRFMCDKCDVCGME